MRSAGLDPASLPVAMTLPSNEAVLAAAEAGAGATALSESVAYASVAAGRLATAPFDLPERPFRLLRHKERYRSRAGDAFAAGYLFGLHEDWPMARRLQLAVCAAAACLSHPAPSHGLRPVTECLALAGQFPARAFQ